MDEMRSSHYKGPSCYGLDDRQLRILHDESAPIKIRVLSGVYKEEIAYAAQ
jgi:hypothetical protein